MRTPKVIIDVSKRTDAELDNDAQAIVTALTGNASFPTPSPTLIVVGAAITAYQDAMNDAANGGPANTELKDQKREELEDILRQLGAYIELVADGDAAKMLSSGFKISKTPTPVGPLPKPTGFEVKPEGKGEISLQCDPQNGARVYQFEYVKVSAATPGAIVWTIKTVTKAKILLTGLESGQEYIFRVVPIGTSDVREYSDEIRSFVL